MKSTSWKDAAELVGIVAIVASLLFVGLQMRQDRQLARAQAFIDLSTTDIELSQLMTSNQSAWVRGLDGEELPQEDQATFDQIARSWHMRKLSHYYAAERAGWVDRDPEARVRSFAFDLYKHPGLRSWFTRFRADFAPRMSEASRQKSDSSFSGQIEKRLAEFDKESPPIPDDKTYMLP